MEDNLQHISEIQPNTGQIDPENQPSLGQNLHQETQDVHKPTPQESFQELRQRAEQAERERNEAIGFIRQLEQMAYQQQAQQSSNAHDRQQIQEQPSAYSDDDIIEGRHLKAEFSSLKRELEEQRRYVDEARKVAEVNSVENRLRTKYNDFDSVVTYENIQKLRELKPEIAASLHQTQDLFNKAAATYTILKDLGIARSSMVSDEQIKAQHNLNKPKPTSAIASTSSLTHASAFSENLTEDRKRQIYEQMLQNARRR